jgi:hypothetical protein
MQKLIIGGVSATGIVCVLVVLGGGLKYSGLATGLGGFAMVAGVGIGVALGILGVAGVIGRMM